MLQERYYQIKEVEELTGIKRKTLFYWERTRKIPGPKRQGLSNYRAYSKRDIERIKELRKVR